MATGTLVIFGVGDERYYEVEEGDGYVVVVEVLGSLGFSSGNFVGLTNNRLFINLITETGCYAEIWGLSICDRLSRTCRRHLTLYLQRTASGLSLCFLFMSALHYHVQCPTHTALTPVLTGSCFRFHLRLLHPHSYLMSHSKSIRGKLL